MVRKVSEARLSKLGLKQLEEREDRLQAEVGKLYSMLQRFRTQKSHRTKAYKDLQTRSGLVIQERDKTRRYVLWKRRKK